MAVDRVAEVRPDPYAIIGNTIVRGSLIGAASGRVRIIDGVVDRDRAPVADPSAVQRCGASADAVTVDVSVSGAGAGGVAGATGVGIALITGLTRLQAPVPASRDGRAALGAILCVL